MNSEENKLQVKKNNLEVLKAIGEKQVLQYLFSLLIAFFIGNSPAGS